MADRLATLVEDLGWATLFSKDKETNCQEETGSSKARRGITLLSHSKYVPFLINDSSFLNLFYLSGTYTHAWMLKEHPNIVARSCFVDPVTFCSWEGGQCLLFLPFHSAQLLSVVRRVL